MSGSEVSEGSEASSGSVREGTEETEESKASSGPLCEHCGKVWGSLDGSCCDAVFMKYCQVRTCPVPTSLGIQPALTVGPEQLAYGGDPKYLYELW